MSGDPHACSCRMRLRAGCTGGDRLRELTDANAYLQRELIFVSVMEEVAMLVVF